MSWNIWNALQLDIIYTSEFNLDNIKVRQRPTRWDREDCSGQKMETYVHLTSAINVFSWNNGEQWNACLWLDT